jgi:integrase
MKGCRPLIDEEVKAILNVFTGKHAARNRALFMLGIKSGFRIAELLSLKVSDLTQSGKMVDRVNVHRRYMKRKTEGRTVLLNPQARAALEIWLQEIESLGNLMPETYVFHSQKGLHRPMTTPQAWKILKAAYDRCGITGIIGTHGMRKTFANNMYDKLDRDLVKMQKALGHRNVNSTVQYLSFRQEDIDTAIMTL